MMNSLFPWHQAQWTQLQLARQQDRLPHALLLTGMEGLGKLAFARQLAASLLCGSAAEDGTPCGSCRDCQLVSAGNHPDLRQISPLEGSRQIKIEAIRELVAGSSFSVQEGQHRIFLFAPAEAMTRGAANALLKTLEEPVSGTRLILLSAQISQLPVTIRSRCQLVRFSPPPLTVGQQWVSHQLQCNDECAQELLSLAAGAPIKAAALAEEGVREQYALLLDDFIELSRGGLAVSEVAEKWLKQEQLSRLLDYLALWLLAIVRRNMANRTPTSVNSPLQSLGKKLDLNTTYRLLDRLFEIKRREINNLNSQLALESILLEWRQVVNGAR